MILSISLIRSSLSCKDKDFMAVYLTKKQMKITPQLTTSGGQAVFPPVSSKKAVVSNTIHVNPLRPVQAAPTPVKGG